MPNRLVTFARNYLADRIRVSDVMGGTENKGSSNFRSRDGYFNPFSRVGRGAGNMSDASGYMMEPITRNRVQLEMMYRSSWLTRKIVDSVADDMVRSGIELKNIDPQEKDRLSARLSELNILESIRDCQKWSRLYGGSVGIMLFDGHDPRYPLQFSAIGKNTFRGIVAVDRWFTNPSYDDVVKDIGLDMGLPKYYRLNAGSIAYPDLNVHYTRVLRMNGTRLPPFQAQYEQDWGMSVIEPLFDRLVHFDEATLGAAQLVNKAYVRIMKVSGFNQAAASLGNSKAADNPIAGIMQTMESIRAGMSNEGLTVIDGKNDINALNYTFAGIADILIQLGQQISGAAEIPMVRLFGQSPAGMNATGDSDFRQYYDSVAQNRETMRPLLKRVLTAMYISEFGKKPPADFDFEFGSLYEMADTDKSVIATQRTARVVQALDAGLISKSEALEELSLGAEIDGAWSGITPEMIKAAQDEELHAPSEFSMPPGIDDVSFSQHAAKGDDDPPFAS